MASSSVLARDARAQERVTGALGRPALSFSGNRQDARARRGTAAPHAYFFITKTIEPSRGDQAGSETFRSTRVSRRKPRPFASTT